MQVVRHLKVHAYYKPGVLFFPIYLVYLMRDSIPSVVVVVVFLHIYLYVYVLYYRALEITLSKPDIPHVKLFS